MAVLISVIIPVYNGAGHLRRCLEYVLHQTYPHLEIIIVDDGSTDNTPEICREYARRDRRVKWIRQKNSGPANARNNGLAIATGEYVHFHDADDFVNQDYYEKMVVAINQSDADIICGEVSETGYNFPRFERVDICLTLRDKISVPHAHQFNVVWRYVYRRRFLMENNLRYPKNMFIGEDVMFMMRATYLANAVATAPGAVYNCINNPTSLGKKSKEIMNGRPNGERREYERYREFMRSSGIDAIVNELACGQLLHRRRYNFFGIPIFSVSNYSNGDRVFCVGGIPLVRHKTTQRKNKFYFFGMCIFRIWDDIK